MTRQGEYYSHAQFFFFLHDIPSRISLSSPILFTVSFSFAVRHDSTAVGPEEKQLRTILDVEKITPKAIAINNHVHPSHIHVSSPVRRTYPVSFIRYSFYRCKLTKASVCQPDRLT